MQDEEVFIEGFGGSAAILLQRDRATLEVYNDLCEDVVIFFRMLRDREEELIEALWKTPYALKEFKAAANEGGLDDLEIARRFYIRSYMSIAGPTAQWQTGWRRQKVVGTASRSNGRLTAAATSFARVDRLYAVADRLRGVQIECLDIFDLLDRYDQRNVMWYLDPPYVAETRASWKQTAYAHEMTLEDHEKLLDVVVKLRGSVMISGYHHELYANCLAGWNMMETESRINGTRKATEVVWMNYDLPSKPLQMTLI
jgi:DNA adenine methylase